VFLCASLLVACALPAPENAKPEPAGIEIDGIVIRNELAFPVTDVMIEVPATGAFAGCGNILPRSACSTKFEAVIYSANPMRVRWKEYGKPHQTDDFVLQPQQPGSAGPFQVEVRIYAMGQAGAVLIE
jgi:hypothetical protein